MCPHCGVFSTMEKHLIPLWYKGSKRLQASPSYDRDVEANLEDFFELMDPNEYCVMRCTHCGELTLWRKRELVYPLSNEVVANPCMPEDAKEAFNEAQRIFRASPRSACALLRRSIECMVNKAGGTGANLKQKIESLPLSPQVKKLAHDCRKVGNDAVHGAVIDFSESGEEALAAAEGMTLLANRIASEIFEMEELLESLVKRIDPEGKK